MVSESEVAQDSEVLEQKSQILSEETEYSEVLSLVERPSQPRWLAVLPKLEQEQQWPLQESLMHTEELQNSVWTQLPSV